MEHAFKAVSYLGHELYWERLSTETEQGKIMQSSRDENRENISVKRRQNEVVRLQPLKFELIHRVTLRMWEWMTGVD